MINWKVILNIAKTHLLTKIKQTSTAALGVTFGIGAYITLVSFMTGLNKMLDDLILNQTPHIHIYNEIEPSKNQPIDLYDEFENTFNVVHSIKPKLTQKKIHNALPIINTMKLHINICNVIFCFTQNSLNRFNICKALNGINICNATLIKSNNF